MAENLFGQRQLRAHQEGRPVNGMKTHNILADDVRDVAAFRPIARHAVGIVGIAATGQIIGQRIDPHIHDVTVGAGHLHAPVEAGPRHAEVGQAAFDEAHDLVAAAVGLDEVRLAFIQRKQPILIGGQAEEPAFLDGPFHRRALRRQLRAPFPLDQFLLVVKGFVAHRIPAFVSAEIQVAIGLHRLPNRLARAMMIGFAGADETVMADIQAVVHRLEIAGHFIGQRARLDAPAACCLRHFQPMFVGAGLKEDVAAHHPLEPRDRIGGDHFIGMADMRAAIGVGNGGGDGEGRRHGASLPAVRARAKPLFSAAAPGPRHGRPVRRPLRRGPATGSPRRPPDAAPAPNGRAPAPAPPPAGGAPPAR